jgi:rRNA-processing protein FCF1
MTARRSASSSGRRRPRRERTRRRGVLLDTNALLLAIRRRFPLDTEIDRLSEGGEPRVPRSVLGELDRLADRGSGDARAARFLAERYPVVETEARGDDALVDLATRTGAWVVTADQELVRRLHRMGITALVPRDVNRLERRPGSAARARRSRENGYESSPGRRRPDSARS